VVGWFGLECFCTTPRSRSNAEKPLKGAASDGVAAGEAGGEDQAVVGQHRGGNALVGDGIGMEETGHGRNNHTSSAGAQGLMQFMPSTWAAIGAGQQSPGDLVLAGCGMVQVFDLVRDGQRRVVQRVLPGRGRPVAQLAADYGVARSWIYELEPVKSFV
jgi:hypothetical protein